MSDFTKRQPLSEHYLFELGFAVPIDTDIEAYLAAPTPVELEDKKGRSWEIYRHVEYPRDLQLWISKDGNGRVKLRRLGRLRERSYEFESFAPQKLAGKLKKAISELSDLSDFMNG